MSEVKQIPDNPQDIPPPWPLKRWGVHDPDHSQICKHRCSSCRWLGRIEVKYGEHGERRSPFMQDTFACCRVACRPVYINDINGECGSHEPHGYPFGPSNPPRMPDRMVRAAQDKHFIVMRKPRAIERLNHFSYSPNAPYARVPWWIDPQLTRHETYEDLCSKIKNGQVIGRKWS